MAIYDLTQITPTKLETGDIINVPYSGAYKTITLPKGVYKIEVWGAQGGSFSSTYVGGKGGYSYGTLTLKDKETVLYCYAGGKGTDGTTSGTFAGGFNGGGQAYSSSATYDMSAGGGASDIRIGTDSLYARVIVAGGGGGAGTYSSSYRYSGGDGGGESGVAGGRYSTSYYAGNGGTQIAAGSSYYGTTIDSTSYGTPASFGVGGAAGSSTYVAGGGGGWYGGGYARRASAGGGSGYVYTSSTASNYPSGCLLNSVYYLTDASTIAGDTSFTDYSGYTVTGHEGDGCVRITVIKIDNSKLRVKTSDGTWKTGESCYVKTAFPYTPLSHIECTGTQWIDAGFVANQNTRVVMDCWCTGGNAGGCFPFGTRTTYGQNAFAACFTSANVFYDYGSQYQFADLANPYERMTIDANKNVATFTGSKTISITNSAITFTTPHNFILFSLWQSGAISTEASFVGKFYSCQIYDNGVLIRDFIPILDANNTPCLYDKVANQYYYNQGTGSFVIGDKLPSSEWIQGKEVYVKTINGWKQVI